MRVLYWYCKRFAWKPALKTIEEAPDALPGHHEHVIVAFVHVEAGDEGSSAETKLVKNAKWLARKWELKEILLHSFTHLGESKAEPGPARELLDRARQRLETAGYRCSLTPWGYFLDLDMDAPGHPLARIFKEFS